jgi:hypothetical protein
MNDYQLHYRRVWSRAFSEFFGWTEEEITKWSEPFLEQMDGPNLVINEPPIYYVAREWASQQSHYDQLSQRDRLRLIERIENILKGGGVGWDFPEPYDFQRAKNEIVKLLKIT